LEALYSVYIEICETAKCGVGAQLRIMGGVNSQQLIFRYSVASHW